jgi:hypothetical protein
MGCRSASAGTKQSVSHSFRIEGVHLVPRVLGCSSAPQLLQTAVARTDSVACVRLFQGCASKTCAGEACLAAAKVSRNLCCLAETADRVRAPVE